MNIQSNTKPAGWPRPSANCARESGQDGSKLGTIIKRRRQRTKVFQPGERIADRFTVIHIVDDGGRDPVYLVWDHERWCPVCLKRMRSEAWAQHEAGVLAGLQHPAIVRCLGIVEDRLLLMEFLEGPTLRKMLRDAPGGLPISDALRTAIHVAGALNFVHRQSVLHLDVKPRNIAVVHGRPVLFDFGISRKHDQWSETRLQGTDPYMAPEQAREEPVSPATDVFALGVTLFELLTGKPPFPDGTDEEPFPQISLPARCALDFRSEVPEPVSRLVAQCMAPEAEQRPDLPTLMIGLHAAITEGPAMWPEGFSPDHGR